MNKQFTSPSFFNARRWAITLLGRNAATGTHCVTGADHKLFENHMFFGSCGPWDGSLENLDEPDDGEIFDETDAENILHFYRTGDLFIVMPQDISRERFDSIAEMFHSALAKHPIRGHICFGKISTDAKSIEVLDENGQEFVEAVKPERCPNWDPRAEFAMPDGSFRGLRVVEESKSA